MRERYDLNDNWNFRVLPSHHATKENMRAVRENVRVRLPHSVRELPYNYFNDKDYQFISSYEKKIEIPSAWRDKKLILQVEGAAHEADVYVNNQQISRHFCGYTAFQTDISEFVHFGSLNTLEIVINSRETINQPPFGGPVDFISYGGLYREVFLEVCDRIRLEDVFFYGNRNGEFRSIFRLDGDVADTPGFRAGMEIELTLHESDGTEVYYSRKMLSELPSYTVKYLESSPLVYELSGSLNNCRLWSVDEPNLYTATVTLYRNDVAMDTKKIRMGFRTVEFKADGFYLNDKKVFLRGLNRHQSFPYTGYAMPKSLQRWDADILKNELGVNYVRTSHYPQSHDFIDRCDELGILVFTEMPGWQHIGGNTWRNRAIQNVEDMVLQYRNHPSIFMWGVRINESQDDDAFYKRTNAVAHRLDPTRPTGGVRNLKGSSLLEDVYTYNDFSHTGDNAGCEKKKMVTSDMSKGYLITEHSGHMFPVKMFDDEMKRQEQALRHANVLDAAMGEDNIAGASGWCMFDYNTHKMFGSGDRICYHGVMDMFRNPKPAADFYLSQQEERPVLSVCSNFDFGEHPGEKVGKIYIFTNAEKVKMYKNGLLLKEYTAENSPYKNLPHPPILIDDYIGSEMGEKEGFTQDQEETLRFMLNNSAVYGEEKLTARGMAKSGRMYLKYHMNAEDMTRLYEKYILNKGQDDVIYRFEAFRDNQLVAELEKSPMKRTKLDIRVDHTDLCEDTTYDMAAVRVAIRDQNNSNMPFFHGAARLEVKGPIRIVGPDILELRGGCGGTFIKTKGKPGDATLRIICGDMVEDVTFHVEIRDRKSL